MKQTWEDRFNARVMAATLDDLSFSLAEVAKHVRADVMLYASIPDMPEQWDKLASACATRRDEIRSWASPHSHNGRRLG